MDGGRGSSIAGCYQYPEVDWRREAITLLSSCWGRHASSTAGSTRLHSASRAFLGCRRSGVQRQHEHNQKRPTRLVWKRAGLPLGRLTIRRGDCLLVSSGAWHSLPTGFPAIFHSRPTVQARVKGTSGIDPSRFRIPGACCSHALGADRCDLYAEKLRAGRCSDAH